MWMTRIAQRLRGLSAPTEGESALQKKVAEVEGRYANLAQDNARLWNAIHYLVFADDAPTTEATPNGVPLPPPVLRFMVAGTDELTWFLGSGENGARSLDEILSKRGLAVSQFKKVLDFGCGCGRVLRHLKGLPGVELHGSDVNAKAIEWCQKNFTFAQFQSNRLLPPLHYPDRTFDLIYAFSVLTHLGESEQARWMEELRRVLVPGGYLILSTHGDKTAEGLPAAELAEYKKGRGVVLSTNLMGTNACASFHPESYVRNVLARDFDVLEFIPEGARGCPPQDLYLMRSRS